MVGISFSNWKLRDLLVSGPNTKGPKKGRGSIGLTFRRVGDIGKSKLGHSLPRGKKLRLPNGVSGTDDEAGIDLVAT